MSGINGHFSYSWFNDGSEYSVADFQILNIQHSVVKGHDNFGIVIY